MDVGPSDVLSKFVGESEASIKGLFLQGITLNVVYYLVTRFYKVSLTLGEVRTQ